jgi:ABC-type glycerol-3-phosphate transport system permease component
MNTGPLVVLTCLTFLAAFEALPLIYMVSTAFKPLDELFLWPPRFIVQHPVLDNFQALFVATWALSVPFSRYVFNSAFVATVSVGGIILLGSLGAYPLAKHKRMPGRNLIFAAIIAALMFAPEVTQIPRYIVVDQLGMVDTYWALILPQLASAYALFLMKQFMEQIPDELLEAARMDGAGDWRIFWQLIMPLTQPAWATLLIITFIATWNDFFTPLIFTRSEAMRTLPLAMTTIGGGTIARAGAASAAALVTTLPTVVIFVLFRRQVIGTMAYSGLKG